MATVPFYEFVDGCPDFDTVYTRCPTCGVVAASGSATYRVTPTGDLDPTNEIRLMCTPAGHPYTVTTAAFLARDAVRTCCREECRTTFACPAEADEVVCPGCRLHQPGPFLNADPARADYVNRVHAEWMDDVRARLRRLRGQP
ncbi:hypothetical protein [Micromonospora sp. CPCC 206061]|uniref:hypothetical protein n=1 Tax=Micromonospora sp. CPCC 206061 TaxID=3122410 RepID=UPI002FF090E9